MANEHDLLRIKTMFDDYVSSFFIGIEKQDSALQIKVVHTKNVALEILDIANSLGLGAEDCYMAEILAILHDIGRFEQFVRYHTYSDTKSEDHALLGIKAIDRTDVLGKLGAGDNALIRAVVAHHNRAVIPESSDSRFLFFLKLLRDADKIDILQVTTEQYSGFNTNEAIQIGLPDEAEVSDAIVQNVIHGKIARVDDMKTLNDFKLLQIGWIFDLNFPRTFEIVNNRKYLVKIGAVLPQTNNVMQAISAARQHLERNRIKERSGCECQIP